MKPIRIALRGVLQGLLKHVPAAALQPLIEFHAAAPHGTARRVTSRAVLEVFRHRPLPPAPACFTVPTMGGISLYCADSSILRRLYYLREYESCEWFWWRWWCGRSRRVLEVGANFGLYSVLGGGARPDLSYVAFEPHPRSAEMLRRNVALNRVPNVRIIQAAMVGQRTGTGRKLMIPDSDWDAAPAGAFLEGASMTQRRSHRTAVDVDIVEAGEYFRDADTIKLDIEGHELEVLLAAEDALLRNRPTLFLEVLPKNQALRAYLVTLAERASYLVYAIGKSALQPLRSEAIPWVNLRGKGEMRDIILTADAPPSLDAS